MSVHTRQLPTDSMTALDALVDPNARHEPTSSPDVSPQIPERETHATSNDASPPRPQANASPRAEDAGLPWYRRESWLTVQISAFVPILGAVLLPETYRLPLCVLGGSLVAIGSLMLLRRKPTPASPGSRSLEST